MRLDLICDYFGGYQADSGLDFFHTLKQQCVAPEQLGSRGGIDPLGGVCG